jgi:hypothetical protein
MSITLQLRTRNNLVEIAKAKELGYYLVSKKKLASNSIEKIEIYDWSGKNKIVADFLEWASGKEEFSGRIIIKFDNPKIVSANFQWLGQNPVKYETTNTLSSQIFPTSKNVSIKEDSIFVFIDKKLESNKVLMSEEEYYKIHLPTESPFLFWTANSKSDLFIVLPSNLCPFTKINNELLIELEEVKKDILKFYTSPIQFDNKDHATKLTPKEILSTLTEKKVRLSRIREVLNPHKTSITFTHKASNYSYLNVKAYWWDDNENRTRGINKAICKFKENTQKIDYNDLEKRIISLFKEDGFEIMKRAELDILHKPSFNHNADLLISKQKEVYFISTSKIIELIEQDKKNEKISMLFLRLAMYSEYKKIYHDNETNLFKSNFEKYLSIFAKTKNNY